MATKKVLKRRRDLSAESEKEEDAVESSDNELSAYEQLRLKNIEEKNKLLSSLGINDAVTELIEVTQIRQPTVKRKSGSLSRRINWVDELPRREPSNRIRKISAPLVDISQLQQGSEEEEEAVDERLLGTIPIEVEKESLFSVEGLQELKNSVKCELNVDLQSCDIDIFRDVVMSLNMIGPVKVVSRRIQSLHIHPSVVKQLIFAGSSSGHLGLWDMKGSTSRIVEFYPHRGPVNRISTSESDPTKILSTSHDGTVICTDFDKCIFSNVFATDFDEKVKHLTWHDQVDANTVLVSHGNGNVGVLDLRDKDAKMWIPCFNKSARTVQHHPVKKDYFIVSSGAGSACSVLDLRSCSNKCADPLATIPHPKGLTSSFFSPDGKKILTTCNDDTVRVYSFSEASEPAVDATIVHNNHTGRWLSVFKAIWHPHRNDLFFIGSLLSPRRMQIYTIKGCILTELRSAGMTTISPVIALHPCLPIVVGGNSSGRVHTFISPNIDYK